MNSRLGSQWVLCCLLVLVVGCQIEISVPSGGRVESESGNYSCEGGQTCSIDVVDLFFDETFVAVPDEGFSFRGWRKANRHFCGGNSRPCRLFTSGFEGNAVLEGFLDRDEVFFLVPRFTRIPEVYPATIEPEGGEITFPNGVVLSVPAQAVTEATAISLHEPYPDEVDAIVGLGVNASHSKRYLGGISVAQDIQFQHPITATIPVTPPNSGELALQMDVDTSTETYWVEPTQLEHRPKEGVAKVEISHFSTKVVTALELLDGPTVDAICKDPARNPTSQVCEDFDELQPAYCLLKPEDRPADAVCCREQSFTVVSDASDFFSNRGGRECQVISDEVEVTFHDCTLPDGSPAPTEVHEVCEISPNCNEREKETFGVRFEITEAPQACFARGETLPLEAITLSRGGLELPQRKINWKSRNKRIATVDGNGVVTARDAGRATIEASVNEACRVFTDSIAVEALDLSGSWAVTEVADERDCEEGINTYSASVSISQVGQTISITAPNGTATGTKQGCSISGFTRETEDDGVTHGTGSGTIASDGRSIKASGNWTWRGTDPDTGEQISCSGSSDLTFTR